jgi:F-type H+-transporting ATPase subunit b
MAGDAVYGTLLLAASDSGSNENVIVPKVSELIIGTVSFGLLVAFFFWKIYPNVKKLYAERTERIEGNIERAEALQAQAAAMLESYRARLAEAQAEAGRIREEAYEQQRQIVASAQAEARRVAEEIKSRAETQLAAERQQVVTSLRQEIGDIAVELATKIVGHELQRDSEQRALVESFIADLSAAEPAAPVAPARPGG